MDRLRVGTEGAARPIRCRACGALISDASSLFRSDGERLYRTFANPAGLLLEIVTVRAAVNVAEHGVPTTEFTWFAGYAWTVLGCATCKAHLGWRFVTVGDATPPERHFPATPGHPLPILSIRHGETDAGVSVFVGGRP